MKRCYHLLTVCGCLVWMTRALSSEGHWAWKPPEWPSIPTVVDTSWVRGPIDAFILNQLESRGLTPAPSARPETLLRRIWLDVLGLPPTEEALEAMRGSTESDPWVKVVDALLASPHYGERWGRHWLDVARYGDSNGGDENHAYPFAYRYRNWVLESLDHDMRFDRFLQAQLAGDLLPRGETESLAGTGFLAIGTKILAEQDPIKKQADTIDEQLDTLSRAFMGLSLGCARCHDHKFDPISDRDYYAMHGILKSSEIVERESLTPAYQAALDQWQREHPFHQKAIEEIHASLREQVDSVGAIEWEAESFDQGNVVIDHQHYGKGIGIISDPGSQDNYVEYALEVPRDGDYFLEVRMAAKVARPGRFLWDGVLEEEAILQTTTGGWMPEHQQWVRLGVKHLTKGAHRLRVESKPLMSHLDRFRLRRLHELERFQALQEQAEIWEAKRESWMAEKPSVPMIMSMADGEVGNARVHVRGNPHQLGEEVPRGFLSGLTPAAAGLIEKDTSGRLELAQWMTDPHHPLTARVFVNRLWQWHFGRGLVPTPDNFGTTGQKPTHPALLDWLTLDFIRHGWSIKRLHRQILTSSVYQMSSQVEDHPGMTRDPANQYYWKAQAQRMDAESYRDALMSVAGTLDPNRDRKAPVAVKSQDPSPQDLSQNRKTYEAFSHRSVYLPVVRSHLYDFLTLMDFPNATTPVGMRSETTVPTQALLMLNSEWIQAQAAALAQQVGEWGENDRECLARLYRRCYSRDPNPEEQKHCLELLRTMQQEKNSEEAWSILCHTLLMADGFLYVR